MCLFYINLVQVIFLFYILFMFFNVFRSTEVVACKLPWFGDLEERIRMISLLTSSAPKELGGKTFVDYFLKNHLNSRLNSQLVYDGRHILIDLHQFNIAAFGELERRVEELFPFKYTDIFHEVVERAAVVVDVSDNKSCTSFKDSKTKNASRVTTCPISKVTGKVTDTPRAEPSDATCTRVSQQAPTCMSDPRR